MTRLLLKILCKKITFFQYKFPKFMSGSTILQTFRTLNFLLLSWRPFQYNVKFKTKTSFIMVSTRFCQNVYEKTIPFQYKVLKLISGSSILWSFTISNLLLLKWWPSEYNVKIEKKVSLSAISTTGFLLKT